ncbi:hypothetical protein HPT25_13805 [Bacillus sp. BRMEA1]|uniref:hypothetical protein n=1 Tax=Neobacillus endophyticus TaxID=2738405 RepID=UPI0015658EC2|nr:hypothetical protein [Neobacillus endophyticus]NRD78443.1 hypothetical protein [Neobacillus endophyticus]
MIEEKFTSLKAVMEETLHLLVDTFYDPADQYSDPNLNNTIDFKGKFGENIG